VLSLGPARVYLATEPVDLRRGHDGLCALVRALWGSLVASCELNGKNPIDYLADVLLRIDRHPVSRIDELLPDAWTRPNGPRPPRLRAAHNARARVQTWTVTSPHPCYVLPVLRLGRTRAPCLRATAPGDRDDI
jgi:hypothetical protein